MKIAFLFSGQLRELQYDLFRKSLSNLTKDLDYAIFAYSWEEMGESLNHKNNLPEIFLNENLDDKINFLFKDFNLLDFGYESFNIWDTILPNYINEGVVSGQESLDLWIDVGTLERLKLANSVYNENKDE